FEQSLLQIISIIYEPAHTTLILNCLKKLEIKGPRSNRPTTTLVNHYIGKLQDSGLLTDERRCHPDVIEAIARDAVRSGTFGPFAAAVQREAPASYYYGKWATRCWRAARELRIGIYTENFELIDQALEFLDNQCEDLLEPLPPVVQVVTHPFDEPWLKALPLSFQFFLINHVIRYAQKRLAVFPELLAHLEKEAFGDELDDDELLPFQRLLLDHYLFQGVCAKAEALLEKHSHIGLATGSAGTIAFLKGDYARAETLFAEDLRQLKKINRSDTVAFVGIQGLFHVLSMIAGADEESMEAAAHQISLALSLFEKSSEHQAYEFLHALIDSRINHPPRQQTITLPEDRDPAAVTVLFGTLVHYWTTGSLQPAVAQTAAKFQQLASDHDYHLFAVLFNRLLHRSPSDRAVQMATEPSALHPFVDLIEPEEPWKRSLQALINVSADGAQSGKDHDRRLVWLIGYERKSISVRPREQKRGADGAWSRGRPVALARLYGSPRLPFLSLQDRKICLAIKKHETSRNCWLKTGVKRCISASPCPSTAKIPCWSGKPRPALKLSK
ncbi:MAG: ATP-dependent helicase, partial [Desulfofustis sp.]